MIIRRSSAIERSFVEKIINEIGVAEAVADSFLHLPAHAGIVDRVAAHRTHVGIRIGLHQLLEPAGMGNGVVIEKGYDVARRHGDTGVAGFGKICDIAASGLKQALISGEHVFGSVGRRTVDDYDLEPIIVHPEQATQRARQLVSTVERVDDDGNGRVMHQTKPPWMRLLRTRNKLRFLYRNSALLMKKVSKRLVSHPIRWALIRKSIP